LVNFYKHYFGDYGRKTSHLSLTEHGAYRQLLDHYYATMTALPADLPSLRRICGAMTEEETEAVSKVVSAFFPLGPDGLRHNKRCDEEISHWKAQAEFNRMVGKLGGRPRKTQPVTEPVSEPVTEPLTEPKPERQPNRNPKLEVRSQKLEVKEQSKVAALPDWIPEDPWKAWLEVRSKNKAPNTPRALTLAIRELERLRADGQDPVAVLEQSTLRGWRGLFPIAGSGSRPEPVRVDL
jgi:uncharacterized protein YdaU (DUF1376 family)